MLDEVKAKYIEMFGGYPEFLLMGADDDEIIRLLSGCIENGHELEIEDEDDDY